MPTALDFGDRIRVDADSGYLCYEDLYRNITEGGVIAMMWMSEERTVEYIDAWERRNNPDMDVVGLK